MRMLVCVYASATYSLFGWRSIWSLAPAVFSLLQLCMESPWRSPTRGSKASWAKNEVETLGAAIWDALPDAVKALFKSAKFKGAPLIAIQDSIGWHVNMKDLVANSLLLVPFLEAFGDRTPSSFLIADVLLHVQDPINFKKVRSFY